MYLINRIDKFTVQHYLSLPLEEFVSSIAVPKNSAVMNLAQASLITTHYKLLQILRVRRAVQRKGPLFTSSLVKIYMESQNTVPILFCERTWKVRDVGTE